ncbi:MAG: hypothetical protein JXB62_03020 [Pirellulales bacterium]|nr:hypothetical protein [Pirellulales bacterium]
MGCFAVAWLGLTGVVSGAAVVSGNLDAGSMLVVVPFFGVFWLVGLLMLYFWYRGRFGKTYVLVESDRLVTKFELFGREKYREYGLAPDSRARLVESYRSNNRPVFAVAVSTTAKQAKFGTFLSRKEKDWIIKRINRHLAARPEEAG